MEFSDKPLEPAEIQRLRELDHIVRGNGHPGLNSRLRRVEWLLYVVLAAIALAALDGRIQYHRPQDLDPPVRVAPQTP